MSLLQWSNDLTLGVPKMDTEHKELISLMNELWELDQKKAAKAALESAFGKLGACVVRHFADEEAHMKAVGHQGLANHCLIHKDLLQKFTGFGDEFKKGDGRVSPKVFQFLKHWLVSHIRGVDKLYAPQPAKV